MGRGRGEEALPIICGTEGNEREYDFLPPPTHPPLPLLFVNYYGQ